MAREKNFVEQRRRNDIGNVNREVKSQETKEEPQDRVFWQTDFYSLVWKAKRPEPDFPAF